MQLTAIKFAKCCYNSINKADRMIPPAGRGGDSFTEERFYQSQMRRRVNQVGDMQKQSHKNR